MIDLCQTFLIIRQHPSIHLGCAPTFYTSFVISKLFIRHIQAHISVWACVLARLASIKTPFNQCDEFTWGRTSGGGGARLNQQRLGKDALVRCQVDHLFSADLCPVRVTLQARPLNVWLIWDMRVWMMRKASGDLPCQREPDIESIWLMTGGQEELWD